MTAEESSVSVLQRIELIANTIYHSILGIVTFFILLTVCKNNNGGLLTHICFCVVSYVPLMAEGIILFSESNSWTQYITRANKVYFHGACLFTSTVTVTVGCIYIIKEKNNFPNAKHFRSDHAITGLVSWIICLACVLLGLATAYSQKLKRILSPVILKLLHNCLGLTAYLIGSASLILGLDKGNFSRFVAAEELTATKWLLSIVIIYSCYEACRSIYYQVKAVVS